MDGRLVARNIFLDGNNFRASHRVGSRTRVGDAQIGLVITLPRAQLAYTHIFRGKEFSGQDQGDHFGAVSLSMRF